MMVKGQWWSHETVDLDNYTFVNCRFDHCVLKSTDTSYMLVNCHADDTCKVDAFDSKGKVDDVHDLIQVNIVGKDAAVRALIERIMELSQCL